MSTGPNTGLTAGADFAGYRVEGLLARGGMGVVYRARENESDRVVALKVIATEIAQDVYFRRRFERETRLAAQLHHPNVVPFVDSGTFEGTLFIATRLIDGLNLHEVIASEGPLTARTSTRLVEQVASALDAAHARGLLHRDVKPGNILLEGAPHEATAYLADFGLSKHVLSTSGLTRAGQWVGTIDYAAPEQIQAMEVGHEVDVYALGCVLYELLTGEVPFSRAREVQKMIAHITEAPPDVSARRPEMKALDPVVHRALAKSPGDRYPSAGDLARAAVEAAVHVGDDLTPETGLAGPPPPRSPASAPTTPR